MLRSTLLTRGFGGLCAASVVNNSNAKRTQCERSWSLTAEDMKRWQLGVAAAAGAVLMVKAGHRVKEWHDKTSVKRVATWPLSSTELVLEGGQALGRLVTLVTLT